MSSVAAEVLIHAGGKRLRLPTMAAQAVGFLEAARFLPQIGGPALIGSLQRKPRSARVRAVASTLLLARPELLLRSASDRPSRGPSTTRLSRSRARSTLLTTR